MKPSRSQASGYRADIDGLRALAVVSIVLFHLDERWVPGGFVGVDIFFVISGYLITSIISREITQGQFSFAKFYRRRILRIAPAYFAATLATVIAGCLLMLPKDLAALARSALWSAFSVPNVYFWRYLDIGYFAPASDQIPLLHLWSLGIEEQFYLLWPAMLLLVSTVFKRRLSLLAVLVGVAIASFAVGQATIKNAPSFAYYMLPARAGELLMGAVLALAPWGVKSGGSTLPKYRWIPEALALLGIGLIGYGLFGLRGESMFPGWNALYPCVGTALLIHAGAAPARVMAPFRWRPIVWIGLISYSMYLWHWPLLAFVRYFVTEISPATAAVCFMAILVLSVLSYRYVELPFRRLQRAPAFRPMVTISVYACSIVLVACGLAWLVRTDGREQAFAAGNPRYVKDRKVLEERTKPAFDYEYNCQRTKPDFTLFYGPRCVIGRSSDGSARVSALLIGDSNAAHYVGVIGAIAENDGFAFRNFTLSRCPPFFGAKDEYGKSGDPGPCTAYRDFVRKQVRNYPYVILGAQWSFYAKQKNFKRDLGRTLRELANRGVKVILLGQVPRFPRYDQNCELRRLRLDLINCRTQAERYGRVEKKVNKQLMDMANRYDGVSYMDVTAELCPRGQCSPYLNGLPVYHNETHLSMTGSWELGRQLVKDGIPLRREFEQMVHTPGAGTNAAKTATISD